MPFDFMNQRYLTLIFVEKTGQKYGCIEKLKITSFLCLCEKPKSICVKSYLPKIEMTSSIDDILGQLTVTPDVRKKFPKGGHFVKL